jgi:hypothetical protein
MQQSQRFAEAGGVPWAREHHEPFVGAVAPLFIRWARLGSFEVPNGTTKDNDESWL